MDVKVNIGLSVNGANLELTHVPHFINVGVIWAIAIVTDVAVYGPLHFVFLSSLFELHRFNVVASVSSLNPCCFFFF